MRLSGLCWAIVAAVALLSTAVEAWGAVGHSIVATIAQSMLHPDVRSHLCEILPEWSAYRSEWPKEGAPHIHCHLGAVSSWADTVRNRYPWASKLHYVNPLNDVPPTHCTYGEEGGWTSADNVLTAATNYTQRLQDLAPRGTGALAASLTEEERRWERDMALRMVVHLVGDMHQPLHLTGRARGGNDVWVHFEGRAAKLHTVWDSLMLNRQIRDLSNHTSPLRSARIESALQHRPYDAYIRWILQEGLGQNLEGDQQAWWSDAHEWSQCPGPAASAKHVPGQGAAHTWLSPDLLLPHTTRAVKDVVRLLPLPVSIAAQAATRDSLAPGDNPDDPSQPLCPYAWTKPLHPLVCKYGFAPPVPLPGSDDRPELDGEDYAGRVDNDLVLQRQFAMAGTRLAAVLNTVLLPEAQAAKPARLSAPSQVDGAPLVHVVSRHDGEGSGGSGGALWPLVKVTASSIIEVALLSVVGYFLALRGVIDKPTQTKFNKINVSFFTPALLFSKVAFTLNPGRLAELAIVPIGFVVVSAFSAAVAYILARVARITRAQRNFAIACAMSPNSNSLPVALMQSLVMTVPQLHWEEEGEPEDTVDGMLGRALTYLVLFSTLGMLTRWSIGAKLLATVDEEPAGDSQFAAHESQYADYPEATSSPRTGTLVQIDDSAVDTRRAPSIKVRRATGDVRADAEGDEDVGGPGLTERRPSKSRPVHWTRSFPNTPTAPSSERGSDDEDDESDAEEATQQSGATTRPAWSRSASSRSALKRKTLSYRFVVRPYKAFMGFMTMPLWAAVISLIVAMIRPLQVAIGSIEPLVGALQTAGSVSVPLTMVVLGAYFVPPEPEKKADAPTAQIASRSAPDAGQSGEGLSQASTLVGHPNPESDPEGNGTQSKFKKSASPSRRLPWMRNPWGSQSQLLDDGQGDVEAGGRRGSVGWSSAASEASTASATDANRMDSQAASNARSNAAGPLGFAVRQQNGSTSRIGSREAAQRREESQERRTIAVSLLARMIITPLVVIPIFAYYCIATRENVADDPVLITCALLLIGSPPALTLAQITQSSKNGGFERLISKTIFVAYVILSAPTTVILTVIALRIAENDHGAGRTGGSS